MNPTMIMSGDSKPFRRESTTMDDRWEPYKSSFAGMSTYYFEKLEYPESIKHSVNLIQILSSEIESITLQLLELEALMGAAPDEGTKKQLYEKVAKAIRAQRMKQSQIKLIESWQRNQNVDLEQELENLKSRADERISALKKAMLIALDGVIPDDKYESVGQILSII